MGGIALELPADDDASRDGCEDVTGFELWQPATTAACGALLADRSLVQKRLVLELGCGLGALGVLCGHLGAAGVLLTDREPAVLRRAVRTAELNGVGARCDFVAVNFARGNSPWRTGVFDLAVASDVLFLDRLARPLFGAMEALHHDSDRGAAVASSVCTKRAPCERPLAGVLGHELRQAVYRGPDGKPCLEPDDSALEEFLRLAGPHARHSVPRDKTGASTPADVAGGPQTDENGALATPPGPKAIAVLLHWPAWPTT